MQSHQQNLKPEVQAVLDICEMQGVPVWYENGVFKIKKIQLSIPKSRWVGNALGTQNIDTVLRWVEDFKKWNPNASN